MNSLRPKILYLALIVSLIVLLLFFITLPLISNISGNKQQLANKQAEFINKENKVSALKSIEKNKDDLEAKIEKVNSLWPDDKEVSIFIVDLENMANDQGMTLKNVAVSEANSSSKNSNKKVKQIQFSFDTKASFDQELAILKKMEKLSRFNTIGQVNFNKDNDGTVLMKVTGLVYYGQ